MASTAKLTERLAAARRLAPEMTQLLREIVAIESPSNDAAGVAAVAKRLTRELESVGLCPKLIPVDGAGPILSSTGSERPVMLLGHLDTVWPIGTLEKRPIRIDGDTFYGPGCYDMKAGLVVALFALRLLKDEGLTPPVSVFFTPLEEVNGEPYRAAMEAAMRASRAVLDFEPAWPGGAVKTERKGSGSYVLTAKGKASHAGADLTKGANAIREIARQIERLSALTDTAKGTSVNIGVVRGGIKPNVVPDHAEIEIDVRYKIKTDGDLLDAEVRKLIPSIPGVTLSLDGGLHYPPLERNGLVLGVYEQARAAAADLGFVLEEISTGGASEASFAAALGVPTLDGLGADGDGAHAEHEHVLLSSLPDRAALVAALIERLCHLPERP
jgi:glutamate carboxypeptidase